MFRMRRFQTLQTPDSPPFSAPRKQGYDVAQRRAPTAEKRQLVVILAPEDFAHLEAACLVFGIGKSELVRRLIRASLDIAPALSLEDGKKLAPIGKELRAIGRNIAQIVKGINLGYAPQLTESEELFRTVYLTMAQMNATIQNMIVAYGSRLRRGTGLKALTDKEPV
jgi:hypothetical protein